MEIFVFWLIFSILAGVIAMSKGRSGLGYFFLSVILTPLVGIIAAAAMPSLKGRAAEDDRQRIACFKCAELVLAEAAVCKHCGADLAGHRALIRKREQAAEAERRVAAADRNRKRGQAVRSFFTGKK